MTWAYYNEIDPFAAAWLRELIRYNLIAPGEVDERSIEDVTPNELRSFRQCHFFAGIGVWSLAARQAGIPDDAPLWSGSCPCQPFSAAGQGGGFADERHLWPAFFHIIEQCRPTLVVGEQVAGADGDAWLDLVSADLDATAYAFGAAETVAAGFGAPHKRSRNYWLAYPRSAGRTEQRRRRIKPSRSAEDGVPHGLADNTSGGRGEERPHLAGIAIRDSAQGRGAGFGNGGGVDGMADSDGDGQRAPGGARRDEPERHAQSGGPIQRVADAVHDGQRQYGDGMGGAPGEGQGRLEKRQWVWPDPANGRATRIERPGPVNGYWRDADWLSCRDERWRPVESGTFPLVDAGTFRNRVGSSGRESREEVEARVKEGRFYNRVGLLRGAGNAITLGQAEGFLRAVVASVGRWW